MKPRMRLAPPTDMHSFMLFASVAGIAPREVFPEEQPAPEAPRLSAADRREAAKVVSYWRNAGPALWFAKEPEFDRDFRERFAALHESAASGGFANWVAESEGALALVLLLDQYPRNAFRGTPRMYASDARARSVATLAIESGHDQATEPSLRLFLYLPFGHSEALVDQDRAVELVRALGEPHLSRAMHHRDIVRRFGRFPHRNAILSRPMRPEEQAFLDAGGYKG
jgi:uncharacterized protein (DUF924 family)